MRVKDLQEFLAQFTTGSDAIKNAVLFVKSMVHCTTLDEWKYTRTHNQFLDSKDIALID
jgi:hypothetical protein